MAMDGVRLEMTGGGGRRRVKAAAEEVPLMSLTETVAVPTLALKAAGTTATSCALFT